MQPDDFDHIGGLLRLSLPEQLGIIAGTAAWLPDPAEAERAATDAVTAYDNAPHADRPESLAGRQRELDAEALACRLLDDASPTTPPVADQIEGYHRGAPPDTH